MVKNKLSQEVKNKEIKNHFGVYGVCLQEGTFDVILDSQDQAVCIVEVTKVSVQPFHQVSADHAYKEGEGDKSLAYWRQVHEEVFTEWMSEAGLTFTPDSKVVLEEFRKVYPLQNTLSFLESFSIWILFSKRVKK